jgi:hypothetical protein
MAIATGPALRIVDTKYERQRPGRYVARIRWRRVAGPGWEIDTRHPGFESWRLAACFANGLTEDGAAALSLHEGDLILHLVNGRDARIESGDAVIWERAEQANPELPEELSFIRAAVGPRELSAMGLDGPFTAMRFGVDEIGGSARLDVRVEADTRRRAVLVTLIKPSDVDGVRAEYLEGGLFDVPRA